MGFYVDVKFYGDLDDCKMVLDMIQNDKTHFEEHIGEYSYKFIGSGIELNGYCVQSFRDTLLGISCGMKGIIHATFEPSVCPEHRYYLVLSQGAVVCEYSLDYGNEEVDDFINIMNIIETEYAKKHAEMLEEHAKLIANFKPVEIDGDLDLPF